MSYKIPRSVLVLVHTAGREVLLLERALRPGYWQSVTGSVEYEDEPLGRAAARELDEETGIDAATGRLARWARRHRAAAVTVMFVVLSVIAGALVWAQLSRLGRRLHVRDLPAVAQPLCARRAAQRRACLCARAAGTRAGTHRAAGAPRLRLVALGRSGGKMLLLVQPRRHRDAR